MYVCVCVCVCIINIIIIIIIIIKWCLWIPLSLSCYPSLSAITISRSTTPHPVSTKR